MRAWIGRDGRTLKALTARNFRLVMGSKPSVLLDDRSWLSAADGRFACRSYRFGDLYVRDLGSVAVFATQLEMDATIDGQIWSGQMWLTDLWRKQPVRRRWQLVERILSRPETDLQIPAAIHSLQLWRSGCLQHYHALPCRTVPWCITSAIR